MDKLSVLCVAIAGITWGTAGLFVNPMSQIGLSTGDIVMIRMLGAAAVMLIASLIRGVKYLRISLSQLGYCVLSGIFLYGTSAFYYAAITKASISIAVVLMYTSPIIVLVYSVLFMKESLTVPKITAVIFTFFGCALVTGVIGDMRCTPIGIFLGLMSGVSYSGYNIVVKKAMQKKTDAVTSTFYCFLASLILSLFFASPSRIVSAAAKAPYIFFPYGISIGIISAAVPYFFYTMGLKRLPASTAAAMAAVEPVAATLFSVFIFNEKLGVSAVLGIALIICAIVILGMTLKEKNGS